MYLFLVEVRNAYKDHQVEVLNAVTLQLLNNNKLQLNLCILMQFCYINILSKYFNYTIHPLTMLTHYILSFQTRCLGFLYFRA